MTIPLSQKVSYLVLSNFPQFHRAKGLNRVVDWDEDFLAGKENEEEKLGVWGKTQSGTESLLQFGLVHDNAVNHAAVTLSKKYFELLKIFRQ